MLKWDPEKYGPKVAELLEGERLNELGPGRPNKNVFELLGSLTSNDIAGSDSEMAACCVSGLWLWHDFLEQSHAISQDISTQSGSYWHGIMHRREPDYSNAKYWFRRVGDHEIFPALLAQASELAGVHAVREAAQLANNASWDPYSFVDLCAAVARGKSDAEMFCRELARCEWQLLFDYCFHQAV